MEQKDMNNLSPAELKAMADALLAADDAKQAEAKAAADKPAAEKPDAEKTTEEKLDELVEKGKKAGKLSSKDLMVLEDLNLGRARGRPCGGRARGRKAGVGKDHGGKAQ